MKNDKKKTLVVTVLGVALLAVGAFQFIGKGSSTPTPEKAPKHTGSKAVASKDGSASAKADGSPTGEKNPDGTDKKVDPQKEILMAMVKDPLPRRDPFAQIGSPVPQDAAPVTPVTTTPVEKTTVPNYKTPREPLHGTTPVVALPPGTGLGTNTNISTTPAAPLRQPSEFAYKVKGVINGPKPMAVFEDDSGNQRLVPLGGSVDGDSKVVGIEKGKVLIRHKGKDKALGLTEGQS